MPTLIQYLNLFTFAVVILILCWSRQFKSSGRQLVFNIGMGILGAWLLVVGFVYVSISAVETIKSFFG